MRTEEARSVHLADYRPPDWQVDSVELDIALDPAATRVRAKLALRPSTNGGPPAPLILDGDGLVLRAIALDGTPLAPERYAASPDRLSIAQPPQRPFSLEIETVLDPSANTELSGLYRSGTIYCTQCEAEGFRRITYFLDRPDVMAVYTTRIEAAKDEAPVLLANGNLVDSGEVAGSRRHFAVWHDPFPKPSYLFAMVGGKLACVEDRFRTASGRDVALRIYVEPGKEARCGHAMESLKRSMAWDESEFGREYDLDIFMIVAVSDFNMGAMENKGLNIFNDKYVLASADTATDGDFDRIEAIVAHEYFHNWTGNRITCRDWFQLCLKEGLTVFRDQEFTADLRSRAVERISDVRALRGHQFEEDAGPLAHPVRPAEYLEINNFYTTTVYEKGAEVVRMLATLLGADKFRAGMDLYFARHDGRAATVEEFVQCFADVSGRDLTQFMLWYSQAGTPEVVAAGSYDAARRHYRLELTQTVPPTPGQPSKEPMVIPLAIGLVGSGGRDLPLTLAADGGAGFKAAAPVAPTAGGAGFKPAPRRADPVLTLSKPAQSFVFTDVAEPPVLSLNRGFSAPIKLVVNQSAEDLQYLASNDSDPFNRWEAFQTLATGLLVKNAKALRTGGSPRSDPALTDALGTIVGDASLEPAFVALMLTVPAEADIARELGRDVDPAAVHAARSLLRAEIGNALGPALGRCYERLTEPGPYRVDPASVGRRSLRNTCLDLLVATAGREAIALASRQYHGAGNMTDRMAALSALSLCDVPQRGEALDDFYMRYRGEALVIDKWFSLQAVIPEAGTLDRVKALTGHPAFSFANPNRLRSLIHAFAMGNHKEFNRPDGAGYAFIAETVLSLDGRNPQVAARLLSAFKSWRALEPARRERAHSALAHVARAPGLSRDVADIVHRTMAAEN